MENFNLEEEIVSLGYSNGLFIAEFVDENEMYEKVIERSVFYVQEGGLFIESYVKGLVMGIILGYRFENRKNDNELFEIESKLNRLF